MVRFVTPSVALVLSGMLLCSTQLFARAGGGLEGEWVLQLGFFANLDNAEAMRERVIEAGFEARVVATGEGGDQRYRVITGRAEEAADLNELRDRIEGSIGQKGFATLDPLANGATEVIAEEAQFEPPKNPRLVAQVGAGAPMDPSPMNTTVYDPGLSRTPQEEIASMAGFTAGGLQIVPTIGLSLGYDDNITASNIGEISSWFYMISPAVLLEIPSDRSVLSLVAQADIVRYQDSPIDDSTFWGVRGNWAWDISTRQYLNLFAEYAEGADPRGEGRRQGNAGLIPLDPDEWERFGYGGSWDYGAVGARGRLSLRAGATDLTYTNNREGILPGQPGTAALDHDWWYYGGTFFWRVAPKTSLLADYQYTDMNYSDATESDSEIHTWMLGVTWDATARTSGTIQYGNQKRKFADPTTEDYSGPAWMASVSWRPRTYSLFTLAGTRNTEEPDGTGDFVLRQDITLSWLHDWAPRFGTNVDIGYGQDEYHPNGRTDDLFYWGIGFRYLFNQHFRFGASINGYDRSSEIDQYEYQRLVYMLTLEASF